MFLGVNTHVLTTPTDETVKTSVTASTTAHAQLIRGSAIVRQGIKGKGVNIRVHQEHQGKIVMYSVNVSLIKDNVIHLLELAGKLTYLKEAGTLHVCVSKEVCFRILNS